MSLKINQPYMQNHNRLVSVSISLVSVSFSRFNLSDSSSFSLNDVFVLCIKPSSERLTAGVSRASYSRGYTAMATHKAK
jgi:hypothetical protein